MFQNRKETHSLEATPEEPKQLNKEHQKKNSQSKKHPVVNKYIKNEKELNTKVVLLHARDILSRQLKFLTDKSTYADAVKLMSQHKLRHLPVI